MKTIRLEFALVFVLIAGLSAAATAFVQRSGWTLYYGDAEAHLNIARRIVDSRTPNYEQIGTVWLPLPHVLTMALVRYDSLWRNGLAGAIPTSACFVAAAALLYAAMRRATGSLAAALASAGILVLNPNLLYLQATPMTEPIFLMALMALLYATVRFRETESLRFVVLAGVASLAATLTRYEGWFLIPFVALYFVVAARRRWWLAPLLFSVIASTGPLYWLAHNWWLYGNPLEFFNGPYSAKSIYERALAQRMPPYPGDRDWAKAVQYYGAAIWLCVGWGAVTAAVVGLAGVIHKRLFWPVLLVALPPAFYVWSLHSGGTPIFVPNLWPHTSYNTRYGLAALPLLAIAGGALTLLGKGRVRALLALAAVAVATAPWLIDPRPDNWACWKESQVNSLARRAWTKEAAAYLAGQYHHGTGIFTSFGDLTGILREAGIPLREALQDGNKQAWLAAIARPDLFLYEKWAVAISGDPVATAVQHATFKFGPRYHLVRIIAMRGAPVIEIYRRD